MRVSLPAYLPTYLPTYLFLMNFRHISSSVCFRLLTSPPSRSCTACSRQSRATLSGQSSQTIKPLPGEPNYEVDYPEIVPKTTTRQTTFPQSLSKTASRPLWCPRVTPDGLPGRPRSKRVQRTIIDERKGEERHQSRACLERETSSTRCLRA